MDEDEVLAAEEVPAGRAFTHPDRTREDFAALQEMAAALARLCRGPLPDSPRPLLLDAARPGERGHRVVLCDERRLRRASVPSLVGFFGEKRAGVDPAPLEETDDGILPVPITRPNISSMTKSGPVNHGISACRLRFTMSRTMRSTHFSTGQMRNGGGGGTSHGLPSGPNTCTRNGVSTNAGDTTPT